MNNDNEMLVCLQQIFVFERLMKNEFLLRKFNKQTGLVGIYWLARENTIRPYVQYDEEFDLIYLNNILSQYNNVYWEYDQDFGLIKPIFNRNRRQIQCLVPIYNQQVFYQEIESYLDLNQEIKIEIFEQQYQANLKFVKVFMVYENEEVAQNEFKWMINNKKLLGYDNLKMQEYDYFGDFLNEVEKCQNNYKMKQYQKQFQMQMQIVPFNDIQNQDQQKQQPQQQQYTKRKEKEKENQRQFQPRNDIEEWFGKSYR